ncbi:unnamed protein product [Sphacelaria rigidula]
MEPFQLTRTEPDLVLILFHRYTGRGAGLIYSQLPHLLINCIRYPQCAMYDATLRAFLEHITLHGRTQLVASIMIRLTLLRVADGHTSTRYSVLAAAIIVGGLHTLKVLRPNKVTRGQAAGSRYFERHIASDCVGRR